MWDNTEPVFPSLPVDHGVVGPADRHQVRRVAWRPAVLELHDVVDRVGQPAALRAVFLELAKRVLEQLAASRQPPRLRSAEGQPGGVWVRG